MKQTRLKFNLADGLSLAALGVFLLPWLTWLVPKAFGFQCVYRLLFLVPLLCAHLGAVPTVLLLIRKERPGRIGLVCGCLCAAAGLGQFLPLIGLNQLRNLCAVPNAFPLSSAAAVFGWLCCAALGLLILACVLPGKLWLIPASLGVISAVLGLNLLFFMLMFSNISANTVVRTVSSPDGSAYCEIVDNDQGALGGATLVVLHREPKIDLGLFWLEPTPQEIYGGRWGEGDKLEIVWTGPDTATAGLP